MPPLTTVQVYARIHQVMVLDRAIPMRRSDGRLSPEFSSAEGSWPAFGTPASIFLAPRQNYEHLVGVGSQIWGGEAARATPMLSDALEFVMEAERLMRDCLKRIIGADGIIYGATFTPAFAAGLEALAKDFRLEPIAPPTP